MVEMESQEEAIISRRSVKVKKSLLIINCLLLTIGTAGGPLVTRLYFLHGGKRIWLSSCLQTAAFPVILIPLFMHRGCSNHASATEQPRILMTRPLFAASTFIGIISGLDNYLYSYGLAWLPVSTSSLIIATQLAFTAVFAFLLVKQRFTSYNVNAVVLLTIGAGVLALHASGDRPEGETSKQYVVGFLMTLGASALYGFILPLVELTYKKASQPLTYSLVLEIQLVLCLFATIFCIVGMLINNDFKAIPREARNYELGETKYYMVLVWNAIIWQTFFLGALGVVFCGSSLLSGIIIALLLPATEILAVIFYKEKFQAEKGVALALSLWGFISYFYGEMKGARKMNKTSLPETEMPQIPNP